MCLILLAHRVHPRYPLVLAANRDEFFDRPTAAAGEWTDGSGIVAGRDLERGGTWLGVTSRGRWAAVTNFRGPSEMRRTASSRGHLVTRFLAGSAPPDEYLLEVDRRGRVYDGFNLLVGDGDHVLWYSNRTGGATLPPHPGCGPDRPYLRLTPGIHGISNHLLDTPWPKVVQGKRDLAELLANDVAPSPDRLLDLLMDRSLAAEHELPRTGIEPALERAMSARFISTPAYGTRASSALLLHRDGRVFFAERRFDASGRRTGQNHFELTPPGR